jgi:hypothetical protein
LAEIVKKVTNIRSATEDGLSDTSWANPRLQEIEGERQELQSLGS